MLGGNGIDHNLCIKTSNCASLVKIAEAFSEKTGRKMVLEGTQPGVQFYTGNFLPGKEGKGGVKYAKQTAFCLETQVEKNSKSRKSNIFSSALSWLAKSAGISKRCSESWREIWTSCKIYFFGIIKYHMHSNYWSIFFYFDYEISQKLM